ncbi:uncharacterized protein [Watersipora subatra]|uniref:uncharacterized protein n=1 Tax=Watersipora subatra TaxID=2589382 RepID=UPI00355C754A
MSNQKPEVVKNFAGKWTEVSVENFEGFMVAIGCNEELMEKGRKTKANEEWIVDGDDITLKVTSTFRDKTLHFKLGEEVDETTIDRRHVRTIFTEKDGKLLHNQRGKPHNCTYTRYIDDGQLVVSMTAHADTPATAVRRFKRVEDQPSMKPEVVKNFAGKWTEVSVENFEGFMVAIGCNEELMEKGRKTKANEEWIVDGDDITLKVTSTFRDKTLHFKLGEEVDETTIDRRHVRTIFTEKDGKLLHNQRGKPHNCTYTRYIDDGQLVVSMTAHADKPATAVRRFKRVEE